MPVSSPVATVIITVSEPTFQLTTMAVATSAQKPRSAYIHFLMDPERRRAAREELPKAKFGELSRHLGSIWKDMDEASRTPYINKSKAEQTAYVPRQKGDIKRRAKAKVEALVASLQEPVRKLDVTPARTQAPVSDSSTEDDSPPTSPTPTQTSDEVQRRRYEARPMVCKTFPFGGGMVMGGIRSAPKLSHAERLERHYQRLKATEHRLNKKNKSNAKPKSKFRRRPIFCSTFPFAAALIMDGTIHPTKVSDEVRHERWMQRTLVSSQ
jgi:Fe-S-cluster containining protein